MKEKLYFMTSVGGYDASLLADKVADAKGTKEYESAVWELIDSTLSCSPEEAKNWMLWYMKEAIVQGFKAKAEDLIGNREQIFSNRCKFLAAYNLYIEMINN